GSHLTGLSTLDNTKVLKTGDTMTGALTMSGAAANVVSGSSITTTGGLFGSTLDASGDLHTGNVRVRSLTRTLPLTVNNEVASGAFPLTNGGGTFQVSIAVPSVGYSVAKEYVFPVQYSQAPNNTWVTALPLDNTGAYAGNDFALDVRVNSVVVSMRLRT